MRLVLDNAAERISHDSNEHVEEGELRDKGCREEEDEAAEHLRVVTEAVDWELSKRHHVLVVKRVDEVVVEYVLDYRWRTFSLIQLKHEHGTANSWKRNHEDDHKIADVVECLSDQANVEGGLLKETQPIEHLHP